MGAANCCKKPTEIHVEVIKNIDEEKPNAIDQDSYPKDTENVQQEISNQKLYEEEGSPQIGGAYEVPINVSTPEQYQQVEPYENNNIQQVEYQIQNKPEQNQISKEDLAQFNINNQVISQNANSNINSMSIQQLAEPNKYEIQQSNISNTGPIDITTLTSQRSAAPVNQIQNIVKSQQVQVISTSANNPQVVQIPQTSSQIAIKQNETEEEDLNKYFQMPPGQYTNVLVKSKTSAPTNINMDEIQKLIQQHESQQKGNIASVSPVTETEDINKYFQNIKLEDIINMKDLPETFGSANINKATTKPQENISTTVKEEKVEKEIPFELKHIDVNVNESLPETFGTFNIQQLGLEQHPENAQATTTTTVTKKTENIDIKDLPHLTDSQIKQIVGMKELPETFGSSNINKLQQTTTTTTTTKTTGNLDLTNLPQNLTSEQIKEIIDMKDLPETFGSNNIKQKTVTTTTTTTTNVPTNIDTKNKPQTKANDINKVQQTTTTTTTTKTTGNLDLTNLPQNLTSEQIKEIIDMKDLPETIGSNIINIPQTSTTTTTIKTTQNAPIDLSQFQLEQKSPFVSSETNKEVTSVINSVEKAPQEEDYSKYFEMQGTTQTTSLPENASQIDASNILHGSNITFKNPTQIISSINDNNNYLAELGLTQAKSSPSNLTGNFSNIANAKKTKANVYPSGINMSAMNPPINLNNLGLSNSQQKTKTTTTTVKTTGITGNAFIQNNTLPSNYATNQIITNKLVKTVEPNQILQYNNTMPNSNTGINSDFKKLW